jgi:N6-L-threonylcarbamoyladenine synthase
LAYALNKPIIPINHIEGHIYSAFACHSEQSEESYGKILRLPSVAQDDTACQFPILALTVSGGHTSLTLMKDHGQYKNIGQTLDDAAGEAFDKVAKLLDLGYPGGPAVSKLASQFRDKKLASSSLNLVKPQATSYQLPATGLVFPRPILNDGTFNFSFSGLKTAVLQKVLDIKKVNYMKCHPEAKPKDLSEMRFFATTQRVPLGAQNDTSAKITDSQKQEICAAFEDAVVDVLVTKTIRAAEKYKPKAIILAGGVAANELLRSTLASKIQETRYPTSLSELRGAGKIQFLPAPKSLCGDNAAMIGLAAYYHIQKSNISSWDKIKVDSNLEL